MPIDRIEQILGLIKQLPRADNFVEIFTQLEQQAGYVAESWAPLVNIMSTEPDEEDDFQGVMRCAENFDLAVSQIMAAREHPSPQGTA